MLVPTLLKRIGILLDLIDEGLDGSGSSLRPALPNASASALGLDLALDGLQSLHDARPLLDVASVFGCVVARDAGRNRSLLVGPLLIFNYRHPGRLRAAPEVVLPPLAVIG